MKKYVLISITLIVAIVGLLGTEVLSQKVGGKLQAFQESLKHEESRDYNKAAQSLLSIYDTHKDDYLVNLRLGWVLYQNRNYEDSKKYYSRAVGISKNGSIEALLARTLPLAALDDWGEVEEAYRSVLKLDPHNYTANLRLGQIFLNNGNYPEAKAYLERVHTRYPGSYEPNLSLGWTYFYVGEKRKAEELLTIALMLNPGDTLALKGLRLVK